jgi:colanic acid biosynthesis glycosyl transferase WcaI
VKKALVIGLNYFPEITGIAKYTSELCEHMQKNNYEVSVVTSFPYYPHWKYTGNDNPYWYKLENISGVKVWRCPLFIPNPEKSLQRILQDISFFFSTFFIVSRLLFKRNRPDILLVISPSFLSGLVGLWYKFWNPSVIMVYHIQDLQLDAAIELGMIKNKWLTTILKRTEKFILTKSDVISTISENMLKKVTSKSYLIKKAILFPNWANTDLLFPCISNETIYTDLNIPKNKKIVLYSGTIGEKQGLEILLFAAKWAMNNLVDIHFLISSSGPYTEKLQNKSIEMGLNNFQFVPLLSTESYNEVLNLAWLHLVIQKDEAADLVMPSKLTSIMAVGGLAIVTAKKETSLYNIINNHDSGWIIEPNNVDALIGAIKYLFESPEIVIERKKNALYYSQTYLNQNKVIDKFLLSVNTKN